MVQQTAEKLGPAERIINTLLTHADHMHHGRPGIVAKDASSPTGVRWEPVATKAEGETRVVYRKTKVGKKTTLTRLGVLEPDGAVRNGPAVVGRFQEAGLFPEVAAWMYRQIADVWKMDNEFAARWASHAFLQDHRDLKVALAAFMLVQSRKGDPQKVDGKVAFKDEDYRDVGEAMALLMQRDAKGKFLFDAKLLLRIRNLLTLPGIVAINKELGFTTSARNAALGRWPKAVQRWLTFREENPALLQGLVKAGFRTTIMELTRRSGFKPETPAFFQMLRWKQKQAVDGRRTLAIGAAVKAAESWEGLTEREVCERIEKTKPGWKRIVAMVPASVGITAAVMAAAIESGAMSDKDMVIATPTLEALGLLTVGDIKARWEKAVKAADDMRAANIARNVQSKAVKDTLEVGAVAATQRAVEEVTKDIELYVLVDGSGSMEGAIDAAKEYVTKFLPAFPLDRMHVASFTTSGVERTIRHASREGVEVAFRGLTASGGTDYGAGVKCLLDKYRPKEGRDALFVFFGDEDQPSTFEAAFRRAGVTPMAFGFVKVMGAISRPNNAVRATAAALGIPCFMITPETFQDVYAIPRTIRNLVAATPVTQAVAVVPGYAPPVRVTLVQTILNTELLKKPVWALPEFAKPEVRV